MKKARSYRISDEHHELVVKEADKQERSIGITLERIISSYFNSSPKVQEVQKVTPQKKDLKTRKIEFYHQVASFMNGSNRQMLKEFTEYWTEHAAGDKKMRFEKEKSFGMSRRISTWLKNQKKFQVSDKIKDIREQKEIEKHENAQRYQQASRDFFKPQVPKGNEVKGNDENKRLD